MESQLKAGQVVSTEAYLNALAESGLMSAAEAHTLVATLTAVGRSDGKSVARELVRRGLLTTFQALAIYKGRPKELVLGNYILLEKLGAGGMGQVYKARHRSLDRIVALKVLAGTSKAPGSVKRFQREVQAAAKVHHPNIVSAFDANQVGATHFLAMEFVDGADLAQWVKDRGPMAAAKTADCILQAARGLDAAHAAGLIHRDIKPSNLLLDKQGVVKVLDLGLVRFDTIDAEGGNDLTQEGSILGTCDYMAPEQAANSKNADRRADVYSLGCTLYYLMTGTTIYPGATPIEKLMAHRELPIPPLPGATAPLEAAYRKMVAKEAGQRYQNMAELIADLERLGPTQPRTAPPRARRPIPRWAYAACAGVVGLVFLTLILALRSGSSNPVAAATTPATEPAATTPQPSTRPTTAVAGVSDAWLRETLALGPGRRRRAVEEELRKRNHIARPADLNLQTDQFDAGSFRRCSLVSDYVTDIAPLLGLGSGLRQVSVVGRNQGSGRVADLSCLRGLELNQFNGANNPIIDLTPIDGPALSVLNIANTKVADLSALPKAPLHILNLQGCPVVDLSPLRGKPLREITGDFRTPQQLAVLRDIKTLERINGQPAEEFWKAHPK